MDDTYIVTTYMVIDDILNGYGFVDDCRAIGTAAEILTVGVVAVKYFQNHHERALCVMTRSGYVHGLSVSRFNRRLHALQDWLCGIIGLVAALYTQGEMFIIDSMPAAGLPTGTRIARRKRRSSSAGACT